MLNIKKKRLTVATTAAMLIASCASGNSGKSTNGKGQSSAVTDMGQCHGVNSCKGSGSCGISGSNNCAKQNSCRGKGWIPLSQSDCDDRNGRFVRFKKK